MSEFLKELNSFAATNFWIVNIVVILLLAFIISWIERLVAKHLHSRLAKTQRIWDDSLVDSLHKPLQTVIWGMAFVMVVQILFKHSNVSETLKIIFSYTRKSIIIIALFWFLMRYIRILQHRFSEAIERGDLNYSVTSINAFCQLARLAAIILIVIVIFQTLGIKVSSAVAFGSVATTLVIGVAAKDTLSNFFGGMVIYWDRPFEIGDWILIPQASIEGTVEYIGWRMTRIRTFDKRPLYVPNSTFMTESVENPSRMTNRRIRTLVAVRYGDAGRIAAIVKAIKAMIVSHSDIDTRHTILVNFTEFADSSLNLLIYCFTKTTDWATYLDVQQDVYLRIIDIIHQHGADCAFPTRTLDVPGAVSVQSLTGDHQYEQPGGSTNA